MLAGHFFSIDAFEQNGDEVSATVVLNPEHAIFTGHFPGRPVVPGVCLMQIVKELAERAENLSLQLRIAQQLKFIQPVDPFQNNILTVNLKAARVAEEIVVAATILKDAKVCCKFSGVFVLI